MINSTFSKDDVTVLLNDVSDKVEIIDINNEREKEKVKNMHYCDFIPTEKSPSKEYLEIFNQMLKLTANKTAEYIANLAIKITSAYDNVVLVSLARAGIIPGILIKRYCKKFLNQEINHYAVGMSRGKGIDFNALNYILEENPSSTIIFVDGWVGKGTTKLELDKTCAKFNKMYKKEVKPILATISDLKKVSDFIATNEDVLLPISLFNALGCGLISRITQNSDIIDKNSYNGAIVFENLKEYDQTNNIIETIEKHFEKPRITENETTSIDKFNEIAIKNKFNLKNINGIKAGINETIRILLKKNVSFVILKSRDSETLKPIIYLCNLKNIRIEVDENLQCEALAILENHIGDE